MSPIPSYVSPLTRTGTLLTSSSSPFPLSCTSTYTVSGLVVTCISLAMAMATHAARTPTAVVAA